MAVIVIIVMTAGAVVAAETAEVAAEAVIAGQVAAVEIADPAAGVVAADSEKINLKEPGK